MYGAFPGLRNFFGKTLAILEISLYDRGNAFLLR